jgi:CheY-like chemotaxis protein
MVEDSEIDRDLTRRLLKLMWPYRNELQIEFAAEGGEAYEMICSNSYALLLLDWRLPGMDGDRLLNLLERTDHRLPVVVLTGLERGELPHTLEKYGAVYLNKDDLNLATLHQSIATALSNVLHPAPYNHPASSRAVA